MKLHLRSHINATMQVNTVLLFKIAESYFSDNDNTWRVTSELLERNKPRFVSNYETTFTERKIFVK